VQKNGTSQFNVANDGTVNIPVSGNRNFLTVGSYVFSLGQGGTNFALNAPLRVPTIYVNSTGGGGSIEFLNSENPAIASCKIIPEERNTTSQVGGVSLQSAQTSRVYSTQTSSTNYERASISWKRGTADAVFVGSIPFYGSTLTVSSVTSGTIAVGQLITGIGVPNGIRIISGSGTTWALSEGVTAAVTSVTMTAGAGVCTFGTEKGSGGGTARPLELQTDSIARLACDTTGSVRVVTALTVATLPGTPAVGMIARVTDATAPAVGITVTGGGAAAALVWYNGANWSVLGV
jgi:hypothetical protein